MIRWSTASIRNTSPLVRKLFGCLCRLSVPTLSIMARTYLMCSPEHFAVSYAINAWMDTTVPVDAELAVKQWERLRETLVGLGHQVHVLDPVPGLPDQVYAANGAFSVDGTVYGARFRYPQRSAEATVHRDFYAAAGWHYVEATHVNEGE